MKKFLSIVTSVTLTAAAILLGLPGLHKSNEPIIAITEGERTPARPAISSEFTRTESGQHTP